MNSAVAARRVGYPFMYADNVKPTLLYTCRAICVVYDYRVAVSAELLDRLFEHLQGVVLEHTEIAVVERLADRCFVGRELH